MERWRDRAKVSEGQPLPPVGKSNTAVNWSLNPDLINTLVQRAVARAGLDPARMRSEIRRILGEHGYPPDLEEKAIELALEQAELFAKAA